jgi:hypothetical protein
MELAWLHPTVPTRPTLTGKRGNPGSFLNLVAIANPQELLSCNPVACGGLRQGMAFGIVC